MVMGDLVREVDVAVVGGGPGGYSAAFRCAELGLETVVVDLDKRLGGACRSGRSSKCWKKLARIQSLPRPLLSRGLRT